MEIHHLAAEGFLQMAANQFAHFGKLREDERAVAYLQRLLHHLGQPRQFSAASGDCRVVLKELRGVVAYLLQFRQCGQHQTFAFDSVSGRDCLLGILNNSGVERSLLLGERAKHFHLQLVWEVGDDALVRLEPAQHERAGDAAKSGGGIFILVDLNRHEEPLFERGLRTKKSGVEELHERPEVPDVVLDGSARQRDAPIAFQSAGGAGLFGFGVLDVLRFVEQEAAPRHLRQDLNVAMEQRVARQNDGVPRRFLGECGAFVPG